MPLAELSPKKARAYRATGTRSAAPLVDLKLDVQLSRNLTARDFAAPGHDFGRVSPDIVVVIEQLCSHVPGHVIFIDSAYHTHVDNRKGRGPKNSPHVDGLAVDVRSDDVSLEHLYELASGLVGQRGAVYLYKEERHVHFDLGGVYDRGIFG